MSPTDVRPDHDLDAPPRSADRLLPLAGPAYAALLIVAAVAFPAPPGGDVVAASTPTWLAAHAGAMIGQSLLRGLAATSFVALAVAAAVACVRARGPRDASAWTALAGGALSGVLVLAAQACSLAAALVARGHAAPASLNAIGAIQAALLDVSSLPATLLFLTVGLTALRSDLLPRWIAEFSLVGVPVALVDAASYQGGPLEVVSFVGLAYFLAWAVLVGTQLARAARPAS